MNPPESISESPRFYPYVASLPISSDEESYILYEAIKQFKDMLTKTKHSDQVLPQIEAAGRLLSAIDQAWVSSANMNGASDQILDVVTARHLIEP